MAFTDEQLRLIARHLRISALDPTDGPQATVSLSKRQFLLLLQALDHYRETHCPLEDGPPGCAMVSWYEQFGTGSIERVCVQPCEEWVDELTREVLPRAFPTADAAVPASH